MRAAKIDKNQPDIVRDLRKAGRTVAVTSSIGNGFPDLVIGTRVRTFLVEIKDEVPAVKWGSPFALTRRKLLTPEQKRFHESWPDLIAIVFTSEEAIDATNA